METDYLRTVIRLGRGFAPLAPRIAEALDRAECDEIVDLCSGGSGPYPNLAERVIKLRGRPLRVVLTDRYPNVEAMRSAKRCAPEMVDYLDEPVDARQVSRDTRGVRTLFDALHHFGPDDARRILADAREARVPIVIAEAMQRTPAGLLGTLAIPLLVWLMTPFVRPMSVGRLALTYVVPVAPAVIFWDGLVSALRTYTEDELREMTGDGDESYTWEIGTVSHFGLPITYAMGLPADPQAGAEAPESGPRSTMRETRRAEGQASSERAPGDQTPAR